MPGKICQYFRAFVSRLTAGYIISGNYFLSDHDGIFYLIELNKTIKYETKLNATNHQPIMTNY
ncbi:hypothetical protein BEL04_01295 [Mucilaginibacter sp. PPCGB 2223]|nr:hypothetical protein BEL04_01295 [Mucilaginibacter sp. PPCGB 2223]